MFAGALTALGYNVWNVGIASGFVDTVTRLGAQDEAVYTREGLHMATRGDWLTPTYLGRFILFKPPLLMWLSGISMKLFGIHALPIRLPALLAGALVCAIIFAIVGRSRSTGAAIAAVIVLVSNQLFHTMARLNMTDILLTACVVTAFACWLRDTRLESRLSFWGFSAGVGAAIMTKSVAGLLPVGVVALSCMLLPRARRPEWKGFVSACCAIAAIALPWHVYQLAIHRNWFVAEYLGVQLVVFGARPRQTSQENQLWFYLVRMVTGDPVLTLLFVSSLLPFFSAWRKRDQPVAVLLFSWILVMGGALFVFQYRSVQYTLPIIPALAMVSAIYSPLLSKRALGFTIPLLACAFAVKTALPGRTWSISFAGGTTLASAGPLSKYCEQNRSAELIVLFPDDEFYSSVLPISRVRYSWIDADDVSARSEPHLRYLGITVTPLQFSTLRKDEPLYRDRLKSWGLDSREPIGTAIIASSAEDMRELIVSHAESDFYLPRDLLAGMEEKVRVTHRVVETDTGRVFLLSKHPMDGGAPSPSRWSCRM